MSTSSHFFSLPFIKKEQIAKDTFSFYFDRSKENWDFHPGQYIQMMLPNEKSDDRGTMRYFTISSSPFEDYLRINTKVMQSTFKMQLASLKKGQEVSFYGPSGDFYLQEKEHDHVFLAGGIGINPFISMFEYAAAKNLQTQMTLLAAFSKPDELLFFDELTQIGKEHRNMKVIYTVTKPQGTAWKGETGRITEERIRKHIPDVQKQLYYIVGPPRMVEATVALVNEMGIPEDHILQEHFSGY